MNIPVEIILLFLKVCKKNTHKRVIKMMLVRILFITKYKEQKVYKSFVVYD